MIIELLPRYEKMPENCVECQNVCRLPCKSSSYDPTIKKAYWTKRHPDCPLREIPDDVLDKLFNAAWGGEQMNGAIRVDRLFDNVTQLGKPLCDALKPFIEFQRQRLQRKIEDADARIREIEMEKEQYVQELKSIETAP